MKILRRRAPIYCDPEEDSRETVDTPGYFKDEIGIRSSRVVSLLPPMSVGTEIIVTYITEAVRIHYVVIRDDPVEIFAIHTARVPFYIEEKAT